MLPECLRQTPLELLFLTSALSFLLSPLPPRLPPPVLSLLCVSVFSRHFYSIPWLLIIYYVLFFFNLVHTAVLPTILFGPLM